MKNDIAIGIVIDGHKDVPGMYIGQNESTKFWLSILNGLKNRCVADILIACVDRLTGFLQTIEAAFPPDRDPVVYYSSNPEYNKVRFLQRTEAADARSGACICGPNRRDYAVQTGRL